MGLRFQYGLVSGGVDAPEPLRWSSWTDTGATQENEFDYSIEKQQKRTSHCDDVEYRWVAA